MVYPNGCEGKDQSIGEVDSNVDLLRSLQQQVSALQAQEAESPAAASTSGTNSSPVQGKKVA